METLNVGDIVLWSGAWGTQPEQMARVRILTRVDGPGDKDGKDVENMKWEDVPRYALADLDNGHYAYGYQLSPVEQDEAIETYMREWLGRITI
jgi:hypothetical protein